LNLFELSLRFKGFPIEEAKGQLQAIDQLDEAHFESYVTKQRMDIVKYHLAFNSFYKNFVGTQNIGFWSDVPVMQKSDLQMPLEERLSKGYHAKNIYVNKTSGSSGHPFIFAKDKLCHALTWAGAIKRYGWYGLDMHRSLQARFYGIPLDFIGYQKERLKDRLSSRYRFPIFDLSDEKMEKFYNHFKKKRFDHINGYTSAIVLFAKFVAAKGVVLKTICPTLKYCVVTSEMLFDSDRILLEKAFGVPVINEYGASELDLIAFDHPEHGFLLNSETLFVEVLDEDHKPLPHGETGKIVITSLYNQAHPMIRYEIGDIGSIDTSSTWKYPILKKLVGRTNDVAQLPSGKTVPGLTFYYVTKSVIEDDGNVKEFIVEQTALDTFKILYTSNRILDDAEIETIKKALIQYLEEGLHLVFERVSVLDRSKRGKLKQFSKRF